MEDKIKSFWANKSKEEAEKAFDIAMTVLMVVEFAVVVSIFFFLKAHVSFLWADTWLIVAYALSLKGRVDLESLSIKDTIMERIGHGKEDNKEDNKEDKDTQDSSSEQGIEAT